MNYISLSDIDNDKFKEAINLLWEMSIKTYDDCLKNNVMEREEYEYFLKKPAHCIKVWQIVKKITSDYDILNHDDDKDILKCACLIHDIRKPENEHGVSGRIFFYENINSVLSKVFQKEVGLEEAERECVSEIVKFHNIDRDYELSSESDIDKLKKFLIIRIADKFSKYPAKSIEEVILRAEVQCENLVKINPVLDKMKKEIEENILRYIYE